MICFHTLIAWVVAQMGETVKYEMLSLWQRPRGQERENPQRQTTLQMLFVSSQSARASPKPRIQPGAQRGNSSGLSGVQQFAGFDAHLRGVASNRLLVAQKKFVTLPTLETILEAFPEGDELELDEIGSFVKRRKNKRWIWLDLAGLVSAHAPGGGFCHW